MAFGSYSPESGEHAKNVLDLFLTSIESRARRIKETVPFAGPQADRVDAAIEEIRGAVSELHGVVDERTDREAA